MNAHVSTGMMALFEVLPTSSGYSTARNLATTAELFGTLFESEESEPTAVVTRPNYSTDPFSSASTVAFPAAVALAACLALAL